MMDVDEFVKLVKSQSIEREPSSGKSLAGIILEDNIELLSNMFKVMGVDTGGSGSFVPVVKEWDSSSIESIAKHLYEFTNQRARKQRATMLRRQVLLKLRESNHMGTTLEQYTKEYYNKMKEYDLLDLLRP